MGGELHPQLRRGLGELLDRLVVVLVTLGVVTTVISILRAAAEGWHIDVIVVIPFFLALMLVLLLRRRMAAETAVAWLVAIAVARAAIGLLSTGPDTAILLILGAACAVVGAVYGARIGAVFVVANVLGLGLIGWLVCGGLVATARSGDPLVADPQNWIYQIASFATFTTVILVVELALRSHLEKSLDEIAEQNRQLGVSEQRYRLLADNMRDVLFLQDLDFRIVYVSPSVERVFGYTPAEMTALSATEVFAPGSRDRAIESFRHYLALATEKPVDVPPLEFEYVRKDGSTFWGEIRPVFVRDETGKITGAQGILRDISARKAVEAQREQLEAELRQAEKLKSLGQLAGGIAHDFNNQLTSIMVHADLVAGGRNDRETAQTHAEKILASARNAADLTSKLLAFARKGAYEHAPVDLHEVLDEVAEILAHGVDRRIRVRRRFDSGSAVVEGDRSQLQNVFLNLGLNARDAMPDGGEVVFSTRRVDGWRDQHGSSGSCVRVVVSDTGCGMEQEVIDRAFEPFFTTKEVGRGTGMGLAAAYGAVAGHGGRIEIASRVGRGTDVSVELPLSEKAAVDYGRHAAMVASSAGGGRALVIDDEDSVRGALTDLLETIGFAVEPADCAQTGIDRYRRQWREIDIVLLDLVLPDLDGRRVLAELRAINPDVRVLLISGFSADDEIRRIERAATVEFLEKPFLLADLTASLNRLLRQR